MEISRTSSLSTVTLAALANELEKIAEAQQKSRGGRFKKFLKNTAVIGAGYGIGHGAGMLAEKLLDPVLRKHMTSPEKLKLLAPALGLTAAGSLAAARVIKQYQDAAIHGDPEPGQGK